MSRSYIADMEHKKAKAPEGFTIRDSDQIGQARRIAKEQEVSVTQVVLIALKHGLPIAEEKLEALSPASAKR